MTLFTNQEIIDLNIMLRWLLQFSPYKANISDLQILTNNANFIITHFIYY